MEINERKGSNGLSVRGVLNGSMFNSVFFKRNRLLLFLVFGLSMASVSLTYISWKIMKSIEKEEEDLKLLKDKEEEFDRELRERESYMCVKKRGEEEGLEVLEVRPLELKRRR